MSYKRNRCHASSPSQRNTLNHIVKPGLGWGRVNKGGISLRAQYKRSTDMPGIFPQPLSHIVPLE